MVIKQFSAAADRNKGPILDVLKKYLSSQDKLRLLEISSGTGQHIVHLARYFSQARLIPTEVDEKAVSSIEAYLEEEEDSSVKDRVSAPLFLDVRNSQGMWEQRTIDALEEMRPFDALININMIHISDFSATEGLFANAAALVERQGFVFTYGPYNVNNQFTSESNKEFDKSLKQRNQAWGIRDTADVVRVAKKNGFTLLERVPMPANNFTLVFQKQ